MDIRIQSIHFDASEQLQAFIQKKVSKLEKYYEDIVGKEIVTICMFLGIIITAVMQVPCVIYQERI